MAVRLNDALRSKLTDILTAYISGTSGSAGSAGVLKVYNGTQPIMGGGTSGTCTCIVTISGLSWNSGTNGTAILSAAAVGTAGTAGTSWTATWARLSGVDGTSYILDGDCGDTSATFLLDDAIINANSVVTLTAASIIQSGE